MNDLVWTTPLANYNVPLHVFSLIMKRTNKNIHTCDVQHYIISNNNYIDVIVTSSRHPPGPHKVCVHSLTCCLPRIAALRAGLLSTSVCSVWSPSFDEFDLS